MKPYQTQFIELAIARQALCFGEFTLKSGRRSPYFFNAGRFSSGAALAELGRCYAAAIIDAGVPFDILFGPAYKGIPLAAVTAAALADEHGIDVPFCYNRKEAKDHGEGGTLVGAPLAGRVLIIDDVITAGTAIREVMAIIQAAGAEPAAVAIGLNRQERGADQRSAIAEIEQTWQIPVLSIVNLQQIMDYLGQSPRFAEELDAIRQYQIEYGV